MVNRRLPGWARPLAALALCLAIGTTAAAQSGSGTLAGTVVDDQGATLPGATVVATEVATGATRTSMTGVDGAFSFASLPPGRYRFQITLSGFSPLNLTDVNLAPTEIRDLGRQTLRLGQLTEVVSVRRPMLRCKILP